MFNKCFADTQMLIMIIEQLIVGDFQLMFVDHYVPSVGCCRPTANRNRMFNSKHLYLIRKDIYAKYNSTNN